MAASSYLSPILLRAILRALWQTPGRLFAIVALVAVAITVYAGTFIGLSHIEGTAAHVYREQRLFDVELRISPQAHEGVLPADDLARRVPGIAGATWRLVLPGTLRLETPGSTPREAGAVIWALDPQSRPAVNDVLITQGHFLSVGKAHDIVIDQTFAQDAGLRVGDALSLRVGEHTERVFIGGIGVFPEHLMSSSLPDYPVPIRGVQAGVLLSQEKVAMLREHALVNSLAVRLNPLAVPQREQVRDALVKQLTAAGIDVRATLWPEDQFSVHCTRVRILSYRDFLPTLIVVFNGLSFLVLLLLVRRMAQIWRKELGTLIAYGVHRSALIGCWALALFLLVAFGGLLGALGALRVSEQVSGQFVQGTGFPILLPVRSLQPLVHAELLCLGIVWPAVLLPLLPLLWRPPAQLLRDDVNDSESSSALRLIAAVGRPLDRLLWLRSPEKLGFRNVVRRPGVFVSAVLSVSAMLVVAASMFLFAAALPRGLDQFLSSQRWQFLLELTQPLSDVELAPLLQQQGVAQWEGISVLEGTVRKPAPTAKQPTAQRVQTPHERSYYLVAESLQSSLRVPGGLGMVSGRYLSADDAAEAVVNLRLSQTLSVRVGDDLEVGVGAAPERRIRLRVVGICTNYAINQVFVSRGVLRSLQPGPLRYAAVVLRGSPVPSLSLGSSTSAAQAADSKLEDPGAVQALEARLRALPQVARVVPWAPIARISLRGCDALVAFVRLYGNLGAAVGLLLIFIVVLVGVSDRRGEYALLRSLGFSDLDLVRSLFAEVSLLSLSATLVCVPCTQLATWIFQQRLMQISDFVPIEFGLGACLSSLAPAIAGMLLSALPAGLRAARLQPATLLRLRA
ncbi:MAG: ABC transporter permease [Myxococcales bacterium]|nr:ABC transporter permease [Myxococcales bacterium]